MNRLFLCKEGFINYLEVPIKVTEPDYKEHPREQTSYDKLQRTHQSSLQ